MKIIAERNFKFLEENFLKNKDSAELMHTYKNGIAKYPAFLDDYAYFISTCIQLYELEYDSIYLEKAKKYTLYVLENFSDEENLYFFFTNKLQTDVILRKKEIHDGATPSGNSVMTFNLSKLSIIFNIPEWKDRSVKMLMDISASVTKYPRSFAIWASLLQQNVFGLNEIAIVGRGSTLLSKEISLLMILYNTGVANSQLLLFNQVVISLSKDCEQGYKNFSLSLCLLITSNKLLFDPSAP